VTEEQVGLPAQTVENLAGEGLTDRLAFLLSESAFGTWDLDVQNGGVVIDARWAEMLGYQLDELNPMSFEKFASMVHPEDFERTRAVVMQQIAGAQTPLDNEFRIRHKDGSWHWIRSRGRVTRFDDAGEPLLLTGINEDITKTRHRDLELLVSRQQLEAAQRIAGVGSWYLDLATDEVVWSEELYRMQGLNPGEPPPPASTHAQLFDAESWKQLGAALALTRSDGVPYELELRMEREGKFFGWMLVRGEAVRDAAGTIVAIQGVALDITERKRTESRLQQQAAVDPLTGLGNRGIMNQTIEQALADAGRNEGTVGCLIVDLDNFKIINDTYGHAVGDDVLREAARRLTETVRDSDAVFRPGGDEFVVLLPGVKDADVVEEVARRINDAFRAPVELAEAAFTCTASVGGALADGSSSTSDLLRDADNAMYSAKQQGRDSFAFFDDRQQLALVERLALETSLRESVGTDSFQVFYQPIRNLESWEIVGAEALLRWRRPSGELLDAKHFIHIAEEIGALRDVGAMSLHEACRVGSVWVELGVRSIYINVSSSQLSDASFLEVLDNALKDTGIDPSAVCVEITESTLMRDLGAIRSNIFGMHDRGVRIALDDFGTGYGALSYLSDLPISAIKLDRSFVRSSARNESDARVLKGSLVLAKALNLDFIAEGIESQLEVERLQELGCVLGHGYFLGHPVSAEDFTALLNATGN
jgi:diguanylate cyclase (GGDEF)-like protein/PAS domain S-box-containing protein